MTQPSSIRSTVEVIIPVLLYPLLLLLGGLSIGCGDAPTGSTDRMPKATISSPSGGQTFAESERVDLHGAAQDPQDGSLHDDHLIWSSDIDGRIGTGRDTETKALSIASHTITLVATDSDGLSDSAQVKIKVMGKPTVSISSPAAGSSFSIGESIEFIGSAEDEEDGTLSGTSLIWSSDHDGQIGAGQHLTYDSLSSGTHTIALQATDSDGMTDSTTRTVTIVPPSGTIAFESYRDGWWRIFVTDASGSNVTPITNTGDTWSGDFEAAISPDGARLAFRSDRDGNSEIYVKNTDGSGTTRVTSNTTFDGYPTWSPNSSRLAFVSERDGGDRDIFLVDPDGSNLTQVTTDTADDASPSFTADGNALVFTSIRDGDWELFRISLDGTDVTQLTSNSEHDFGPSVSPSGGTIAFYRRVGGQVDTSDEIFTMNADGSQERQLTDNSVSDSDPAWSPDGTHLVFNSGRGQGGLFRMTADGDFVTRITAGARASWGETR